jgi:ribosomal protein L11 methyltransferase
MANSQWWELQTICEPALDELLSWQLQERGSHGTVSQIKAEQLYITAYFEWSQMSEADLGNLSQDLRETAATMNLSIAEVSWRTIEEEDWSSSWKDYWHPTPVGDRLIINPAWLPLPEQTERIVLQLDPGVAFGTGAHATTQLCLVALEGQFREPIPHPYAVADIGCGTGILAIAALKFGADKAYAVDTDPLAVQAAQECRDLNGIEAERMMVAEGSIDGAIAQVKTPVDGFCCNILAHVIIELIPQMAILAKPEGWGILSGILQKQVPEVAEALSANGWQIQNDWQQEDWACLKIIREI